MVAMSIYQKIERVEHKDPVAGAVNLKEENGPASRA